MEEGLSQTEVLLREIAANTGMLETFIQGTQPAEDDLWGCSESEIRRDGLQGTALEGETDWSQCPGKLQWVRRRG